jgi:hypothetical protein
VNAQRMVAQRRKKDEEDIAAFAAEKRAATQEFCVVSGGHFFGDWHAGGFNPIFRVASYEERICEACGHRALRQPVYDNLQALVLEPENNPRWVTASGPIIDLESED